jgi:hypothetical protein
VPVFDGRAALGPVAAIKPNIQGAAGFPLYIPAAPRPDIAPAPDQVIDQSRGNPYDSGEMGLGSAVGPLYTFRRLWYSGGHEKIQTPKGEKR